MAVKKAANVNTDQVSADDQAALDILTGIIDQDARTYTMQKTLTIFGGKREGTFRFHYPTIGDRVKQGLLQSQFLGGVSPQVVDVVTFNLTYSMAFLASICDQMPQWFRFELMESQEELGEMFREVNEFVESFRRDDDEAADAAGGEDAAGEAAVANS